VSVHQKVEVTVISVDLAKKRISLSLKGDSESQPPKKHTKRPADRRDMRAANRNN